MPAVASILVSVATHNARGGGDDQIQLTEHLDREPAVFEVELASDAPVAVSFNGMAAVSVVKLESVDAKVRARLTSADGVAPVPVDPVACVVSRSVPFTALDLTRVAGGPTVRVRVTLGAPET